MAVIVNDKVYRNLQEQVEKNTKDIDVLFVEYNWVSKHKRYSHFKDGSITCPYYPTVYNVGFTGEGKYKPMIDYKAYKTWCSMIERCYSEKYHEKFPTYKDCYVKDECTRHSHNNAPVSHACH